MLLSLPIEVRHPSAHFRHKSYKAMENTVTALSSYTHFVIFNILI